MSVVKFRMTCTIAALAIMLLLQSSKTTGSLSYPPYMSTSNFTDQQSLLALKSQITGNNLLVSNWTESANFCNWVGVSCSKQRQRVTGLNLSDMGLEGTISPHIGNLSFLVEIDLRKNSFHGHIITELSRLQRLEILLLEENNFGGLIPPSLQQCRHLQVISLVYNKLVGPVPEELTTLPRLQTLYLSNNNLTGTIPSSLGNISTLKHLAFEYNQLHGNIAVEIAYLPNLVIISAGNNYFKGPIPRHLFNISSLKVISFAANGLLSGELPFDTGLRLPNLLKLYLGENQFTGNIPLYISNSSMLNLLDLSFNELTGTVPTSLGNLGSLEILGLDLNRLTLDPNGNDDQLSFLTDLTKLRSLIVLSISGNPFHGTMPHSIGNLSSSLQTFYAFSCQIKGPIPESIGSLRSLNSLVLSGNYLSGTIPSTIKEMKMLQTLYLDNNMLHGFVPTEICHLTNLGEIDVQSNQLSGPIPLCIGNISVLQFLFMNSNAFNSTIPSSLWSLSNLLFLNLSSNSLHGGIFPSLGGARKQLQSMDLSWNQISGNIPGTLATFQSLSSLNLSYNSFHGPIPKSLGELIALDSIDLSYNNLSGPIPKSLEAISYLQNLNLSHNRLSGEIPTGGPFKNLTAQSFFNNDLCGKIVSRPCKMNTKRKSENKLQLLIYIVASVLVVIVAFGVSLCMLKRRRTRNLQRQTSGNTSDGLVPKIYSYQELCLATNNFCEANLLGIGGFGSVYKAVLGNGEIVAVKILNLQVEGAIKSFDAECKVLRSVRHRNLVKVISSCTNPELRALVLEYMSNGSLHKWLYSHNYCLSLLQRVSIMLDVALAVEYLHHGLEEAVVHHDLKPSNVMLDKDMVAHVGDFGIAKILAADIRSTETNTLGTFGYIAPEYGVNGRVSAKGDIYSYGIMLLETFTRKSPTDEMFDGELSLRKWVNASLPDQMTEVVDHNLLPVSNEGSANAVERNLLAILDLGIECCQEAPEKRSDMKEVVIKLTEIKLRVLSGLND